MPALRPRHEALHHYFCEFDALALLRDFERPDRQATPGTVTNFLGMKVPVSVFPSRLTALSGKVEPLPDPGNWHADIAEWAAALRSVALAQGRYRIVELGCGWGCWLANMGTAARDRGLAVELIGVEGDVNHLANAREVLALNGFGPEQVRLVHGVAAGQPGQAIFPNPAAGTAAWGGQAIFHPDAATLSAAARDPSVQVLDCQTLDMLSAGQTIDLLHVDIQGAETDYVRGNFEALSRLVRRVLIGTHSRIIEGELMAHFLAAGWRLEMERAALAEVIGGRPVTRIDGVQLWANPALT